MTRASAEIVGVLRSAREDHDTVVALARDLVRIPSRAGADPYGPVLDCMSAWLTSHGLEPRRYCRGAGWQYQRQKRTVAMVAAGGD